MSYYMTSNDMLNIITNKCIFNTVNSTKYNMLLGPVIHNLAESAAASKKTWYTAECNV